MGVTKMVTFCGGHKCRAPRLLYRPKPHSIQNFNRSVIFNNQKQSIDKSPFQHAEDVLAVQISYYARYVNKIPVRMSKFEKLGKGVSFLA